MLQTTNELPSYYHLSPKEIDGLSFRVTLRHVGEVSATNDLCKDIAWQEKLPREGVKSSNAKNDNHEVCVFTYTHAEAIPCDDEHGFILRDATSLNNHPPQLAKLNDRKLREESCVVMVIMAATEISEVVLCVMKLYPITGLLYACPALSETENENAVDSAIFLSTRSIDGVIINGPLLEAYSFALNKSMYKYSIERKGNRTIGDDIEIVLAEQNSFMQESISERRDLIRKEFDAFDCMYEDEGNWTNQEQIDIVSVDGFAVSNMLLCMPLGSSIVLRYRVLKSRGKVKTEILRGGTANVDSYLVSECLEFATHFAVAFICVIFALLLCLGDTGDEFLLSVLLSIVPLAIITSAKVFSGSVYHFNHQFSLLYNTPGAQLQDDADPLLLELRAYFKHNFGLTSLAGFGTVTIPTEPGTYEVFVPTWKPISCPGISQTRGRMHDYYLGGSCLSEIESHDPIPTSDNEGELIKDAHVSLFSKGGLVTDSSGTIHVRIHVSKVLKFRGDSTSKSYRHPEMIQAIRIEDSKQHRVKMRETIDEVLSRVRRNKRGRSRLNRTCTIYPGDNDTIATTRN